MATIATKKTKTSARASAKTAQKPNVASDKKLPPSFDDKAKHLRGTFFSGVSTTSGSLRESLEGFGQ